uniref:Uncharacterized protein n=1 Tax=Arion vulgaris TaxID=1028688 RepID=A0A0B7B075_9EUPU
MFSLSIAVHFIYYHGLPYIIINSTLYATESSDSEVFNDIVGRLSHRQITQYKLSGQPNLSWVPVKYWEVKVDIVTLTTITKHVP